ncbi:hypothetical protein [Polaromonas sp. UC242_47]|uniref:hypothetical protein n=1 Tax=Polaromonas sp. UC242_47 TaxID=3374626 RepID=UPI0037AF83F6
MSDPNQQLLQQMGEVQGQLKLMMQVIQSNHDSTHQRINDFRHAIEGRLTGVEARVGVIEKNERGTAMRVASGGALAGAVVAAAIEAIKMANR